MGLFPLGFTLHAFIYAAASTTPYLAGVCDEISDVVTEHHSCRAGDNIHGPDRLGRIALVGLNDKVTF